MKGPTLGNWLCPAENSAAFCRRLGGCHMKHSTRLQVAIFTALALIALFSPLAFPQGRRGGGFGRGGGAGLGTGPGATRGRGAVRMDEATTLLLITTLLNLTDAQHQQLQDIFDSAIKNGAPIAAQLQSSQDALFEAVRAGKSESEIKSLADQRSSLSSQITLLQVQTFSKMWAMLTAEQKPKVDSFMYDNIGEFLFSTTEPPPPRPAPAAAPTPTVPAPTTPAVPRN